MTHSPRPILVTGGHRTGTSWVGKILAAGGEVGLYQRAAQHPAPPWCHERPNPVLVHIYLPRK